MSTCVLVGRDDRSSEQIGTLERRILLLPAQKPKVGRRRSVDLAGLLQRAILLISFGGTGGTGGTSGTRGSERFFAKSPDPPDPIS